MSAPQARQEEEVKITIDGKSVTVPADTTIYDAACKLNIDIPVLCHQEGLKPVGVCRMCVVQLEHIKENPEGKIGNVYKGKPYAAACIRRLDAREDSGLVVKTNSRRIRLARKSLLQMLMADHPVPCIRQQDKGDCKLEQLAGQYDAMNTPYTHRQTSRGRDDTSPIILVDHAACILCDRCVRACADLKDNFVIARQGKGYDAGIAFDLGTPMGSSSCVSCGECMFACPTGALTNTVSVAHEFEVGTPCETHELLALPIFQHVSGNFLDFNKGAIVKRSVKQGEYFFYEGDGSSSAFYILKGNVNIFISTELAHVHTEKVAGALSSRMRSKLLDREQHRRHGEDLDRKHITVDGRELSWHNPETQLGPGELFGEMSCLNSYPHSATAQAATDCVVLEMRRNVVDALRRNKSFCEKVDDHYLTNTFENHLRKSDIFSSITKEFIHILRPKVRLKRYAPGQTIFKQGEVANAFYLVRRGFIKVTQSYPGGDLVLAYLPAGSHFGEISLLGDGKRTATCSALDHVDLVRIAGEDFKQMLDIFPNVRAHLETIRDEHMRENAKRFSQVQGVPVDEFLRQGLMEANNLLVLDLDNCTRCDQCVKACADAHDGVTRLVRDGLRVEHFLVATSCRHCRDPLCMVCPVGAITRQPTLDIIIDDTCIGCTECAQNCPYGNINMHEFDLAQGHQGLVNLGEGQARAKKARVRKATSCNLCHELKEPSCVYACPHDAAHRVSGEGFQEMLKK